MKHLFTSMLACTVAVGAIAIVPDRTGTNQQLREINPLSLSSVNAPKATVANTRAFEKKTKASAAHRIDKSYDLTSLYRAKAKAHTTDLVDEGDGENENVPVGESVVLLDTNFDCLSAGSVEDPVEIATDDNYNIPEDVIGEANYGYGGEGIYEAGGQLLINGDDYGYLWTPNVLGGGNYTISMDICLTEGELEEDDLVVEFYDGIALEGIDIQWDTITQEMETITLEFDGTTAEANTEEVYFMIYPSEGTCIIKNIKIEAVFPAIKAPVALDYTDFTGTAFTANWSEVEGATEYLLNVYEYDFDLQDVGNVFLEDVKVEGTSYVVEDITPGVGYIYGVKASDGENISATSNLVLMDQLLVPTGIAATIDPTSGVITASWDATPGANIYQVNLYTYYTAPADEDHILADADFSDVESTGTIDAPEILESAQIQMEQMPGWTFTLPAAINGAIGIEDDAFYSLFGINSSIESPVYDLSQTDGKVNITISAASGVGAPIEIYLLTLDEEDGYYYPVDSYKSEPLTTEFSDITCTLEGGDESTIIAIYAGSIESEDDMPNLFLKSAKVILPLKAGDTFIYNSATEFPETTECTFDAVCDDAYSYAIEVTAYNVDADMYVNLYSEPSERTDVEIGEAGVEGITVDNDTNAPATYFDLGGRRVANPSAAGLYIKRQGTETTKVIVK